MVRLCEWVIMIAWAVGRRFPHLHGLVLLAVKGVDVLVELATIIVAFDCTEDLEGLAEGLDIFDGCDWSSEDSGHEAEQDHGDGNEKNGWTEEHRVCVCVCVCREREREREEKRRVEEDVCVVVGIWWMHLAFYTS